MSRRVVGVVGTALIAFVVLSQMLGASPRVARALDGRTRVASAATDTVVVETSTVRRILSPDFFGINYVGFWDKNQGSATSARALAQTPTTVVRFAGGAPADWYDWANPYYL